MNDTILGITLVLIAGFGTGSCAWPMKAARKFKFEHSWFVGMLVGLVIIPWASSLIFCPDAREAISRIDKSSIILANVWAAAWGLANVLYGLCVMRIGAALTGAILSGCGVAVGVTMPMIVKGSGLFQDSPNITSPAGIASLSGVVVILIGVALVSFAGFGRDKILNQGSETSGGFLPGLIMCIIAGFTSAGISLAFVYGQAPIVKSFAANGAGPVVQVLAVWALALFGGALVNLLYPAFLMTKNKSWGTLIHGGSEILLASVIGIQFITAITMLGRGMFYLGPLGGSIGFGIQQSMQIMGNQLVGFMSGEWKDVYGTPRKVMYFAIVVLIGAAFVLAFANTLVPSKG